MKRAGSTAQRRNASRCPLLVLHDFGVSKWRIGVPKLGDVAWSPAVPDNDGTARTVVDLDPARLVELPDMSKKWDVVAVVVHRRATGLDSAWRDSRFDFKIANARLVCVIPVSSVPCQHLSGILEWKPGTGALLDRLPP